MGDFNARLGARMSVHETGLGQYELGHRHETSIFQSSNNSPRANFACQLQ